MTGTPSPERISTKLQKIAKLAREAPDLALTTLAHHIDIEFMHEAYRRTRKSGAVGVDGQTAEEYAGNLEINLSSLLDRFKSGNYRAPAVRRVHIPKGDGRRTRPIGIPTFEDKVLQRAVTMILGTIYEQDFLDGSYGFRPGRSAHQALSALREGLMTMGGGWVLEVDIASFFDTLDHGHLRSFLDRRVRDGVLRRQIDKWLKAGVLEEGVVYHPETGTPQGGVISPLLANVYLHEVLDQWFEEVVQPRLDGKAFLVRYADDFVLVFQSERDARRVHAVLPKRFAKYGLRLHPEKTRLVRFRQPPPRGKKRSSTKEVRPEAFDLLGFTHYWGLSRNGHWIIKRRTARLRLTRALQKIRRWCRVHRHWSVADQRAALAQQLRGHYAYYGITGNGRALACLYYETRRAWRMWLNRRSQRNDMTWARFVRLLARHPLPEPRVVHSVYRYAAKP